MDESESAGSGFAGARAELVRRQKDARSTIYRGVLLIAFVPIVFMAALVIAVTLGTTAAVLALLAGTAYALIGGVAGIGTVIAGTIAHRRASRRLHDHDHVRQLPAARVVVRSHATDEA